MFYDGYMLNISAKILTCQVRFGSYRGEFLAQVKGLLAWLRLK